MKGGDKDGISTNKFPKLRWAVQQHAVVFQWQVHIKSHKIHAQRISCYSEDKLQKIWHRESF